MTIISKHNQYRLLPDWPRLPDNLILGNPTGIGMDSSQQIVIFHRAERRWPSDNVMPDTCIPSQTILTLDRDSGNIISGWGEDLFIMPHGLHVDMHDNVWVTDVGSHQVFKFDRRGTLLMKLGEAGIAGNGPSHFSYPTDINVTKDGSFYVSDGYGNSRVLKFSPTGEYIFEWGRKGNKEGEFKLPHAIALDNDENIYIADRENNRIQVFDPAGKFLKQCTDKGFGKMSSLAFRNKEHSFVAVDFTVTGDSEDHYNSGILFFDSTHSFISRFESESSDRTGANSWYHNVLVDNEQNIYITDILRNRILKFVPE
jgi:peptidylamidoglycolate lyase